MVYEKISEFIKSVGISRSKLYRFYKRNDELWQETKLKNNKRLIPTAHAKYFDTEILHDELKDMIQENKSLRRLIDCLADKNTVQSTLWMMEWSYFFTVAYRADRNKKSCYRLMTGLHNELVTKYGDSTEIRMFFTTEPFVNRIGYHNHFVIFIEDKKLHQQVVEDIKAFFSNDRIDFSIYDRYKAGLFYIAKEGLQNEDWDIL